MSRRLNNPYIFHDQQHVKVNYLFLACLMLGLSLFYPILSNSQHIGTTDLHAVIEMLGALIGLLAGISIIGRFLVVGERLHLLTGLAFFANASADFAHGLMAFIASHEFVIMTNINLEHYIPGTYVSGRILLAFILLAAPFLDRHLGPSHNAHRETLAYSLVCISLAVILSLFAYSLPLPEFIYPENSISRPVDFVSAIILLFALLAFLYEYHRSREMLTWWVVVSIGVNLIGQIMMSQSATLYDSFFEFAHVLKVIGYTIPLLGAVFFTVGLLKYEKELSEKFELMAHNDELTDLPNRTLFYDRFVQEVKRFKRLDRPFSVLVIDLNKFKPINDTHGHLAGDTALKTFAKRVQSCLRDTDTIARIGGDEFAVLLGGAWDTDDVSGLCEKIIATATEPVEFQNQTFSLGVSIGVIRYPRDASSFDESMEKADTAMYVAKGLGGSNYFFYSAQ